jgi:AraC-like DNA-binding protein
LTPATSTYLTQSYTAKRLKNHIEGITFFQFGTTSPVYLSPEGRFELILQLDSSFHQNSIQENEWKPRPSLFVGGLHNNAFLVKPEKRDSKLISVRFKSHCARYFIPDKLNLFKNERIELSNLFNRQSLHFLEDVHETNPDEKNIELIEDFLIGIYQERKLSSVEFAVKKIEHQRGFVNVKNLAWDTCLSIAQFRKRFNEEVGMSPKEYSRVIRIRNILQLLGADPRPTLTELTYHMGYFDQSHFIRDFRAVMGMSPKHFLKTS